MTSKLAKATLATLTYILLSGLVQAMTQENIDMDRIFDKAMSSYDQVYINAEETLLNGGQAAVITLQKQVQSPDPIACLIAKTLLKRIQNQAPEQQKALDYLEHIPKRLAKTPRGKPSPQGVANDLNENFGDLVLDILSLRLVKQTEWPAWQTKGVLFYLRDNNKASTFSALIRFAAETKNKEWQELVINILKTGNDKNLKEKLTFERKRIENMKKKFPDILDSLNNL